MTMTLIELTSPSTLINFLTTHPYSLICFSATWCGPCKASKPQLELLAHDYASNSSSIGGSVDVNVGIVYEHVLGNDIHKYRIRVFPTYVLFKKGGQEVGRV